MPIHLDRQDRVAILTLDEPERRNALTAALVADIVAAMDELDADTGVGAVVVTGAPPAFCSGADVAALAAMASGTDEPADVRDIYAGFLRVLDSPLPTVAAVNGPAVGAGCNLALACDVRIAGTAAVFDARFLRIGIHPGGGHTWLLDRAAGPQATAAMDLFGERLDGARAAAVGLAWECVADDALLDRAVALATRAAEVPRPLSIRTKATIRHTAAVDAHDDAMRYELGHQIWSLRENLGPAGRYAALASPVVATNDLAEPIEAIPVETTGRNPIATAIAWIAVVVAVVLIGSWVWNRWIDPPVGDTIDRYVDGTAGVEFADPVVAQFRVTMPTKFEITSGANEWGPIVTVSDNPGGGYQFAATKTPQPATALDSYEEALNRLAGQLATAVDAEIVSQTKPIPLNDVGFKLVVYRKGDTYWHAQLELLQDRVYTVIMKAPNDDDAPFLRLTKSFQILGPR